MHWDNQLNKNSKASGVCATRRVVQHKRVSVGERWGTHEPVGPSTGASRWAGELSSAGANQRCVSVDEVRTLRADRSTRPADIAVRFKISTSTL